MTTTALRGGVPARSAEELEELARIAGPDLELAPAELIVAGRSSTSASASA